METVEERIEKFINGDEGYRFLLTKHQKIKFSFIRILTELENLECNADLMNQKQFDKLIELNKKYRDEFLGLIKEMADSPKPPIANIQRR